MFQKMKVQLNPNNRFFWFWLLILPPFLFLVYQIIKMTMTYDGRCSGLLTLGEPCTSFEYLTLELSSTFFVPFIILVSMYWFLSVSIFYTGWRVFLRLKK